MDNPKINDFGKFARCHKLGKRSIVRGLSYPFTGTMDNFKERPQLVISDIDECPGSWNSIGIITVPIFSNPHSDFDIPIFTDNYMNMGKISFIRVADQIQWQPTRSLYKNVSTCTICPDRVFDLVIKVKKLILKGDRESYVKARELIKDHRVEFMNRYGISDIYYILEPGYMYTLHNTGEESVKPVKRVPEGFYTVLNTDVEIEKDDFVDNNEDLDISKPEDVITEPARNTIISESEILHENENNDNFSDRTKGFINPMKDALNRASINTTKSKKKENVVRDVTKVVILPKGKNKENETTTSKKKIVRISQCSDEELIKFVSLINNCGTCLEAALKMDVTPLTISNRFKQTMKEFERRGMHERIIEWPFSRDKGGSLLTDIR